MGDYGRWITYEELPFEEGPDRHSRYVSRKVQINTRNPDYCREVPDKSRLEQLAYVIPMIGTCGETISKLSSGPTKLSEFLRVRKCICFIFINIPLGT